MSGDGDGGSADADAMARLASSVSVAVAAGGADDDGHVDGFVPGDDNDDEDVANIDDDDDDDDGSIPIIDGSKELRLDYSKRRSSDGGSGGSDGAPANPLRAAADVPSAAFHLLYTSAFFSAFGDRMGEFGVPIVLSLSFRDTLLPAAVYQLVSYLALLTFGTYIGTWVDLTPRMRVIKRSLLLQNVAVVTACLLLLWCVSTGDNNDSDDDDGDGSSAASDGLPPASNVSFLLSFVALMLAGACGKLISSATNIALNKDWIVVLCQGDKRTLTHTNAAMQRIDMLCAVLGPLVFSLVIAYVSLTTGILLIGAWNLLSYPCESYLLRRLYMSVPLLHDDHDRDGGGGGGYGASASDDVTAAPLYTDDMDEMSVTWEATAQFDSAAPTLKADETQQQQQRGSWLAELRAGWTIFSDSDVMLVALSYSVLWLTVLAPGPVIAAWLLSRDVPEVQIALYQGVASVSGLLGSFALPFAVRYVSNESAGAVSVVAQFACLLPCGVFFLLPDTTSVWLFLCFLVASRVFLWSFDLSEVQIVQEYVPDRVRGRFTGVQVALYNVAALVAQAASIVFHKPSQFGVLVAMSLLGVLVSVLTYGYWWAFKWRRGLVTARGHAASRRGGVTTAMAYGALEDEDEDGVVGSGGGGGEEASLMPAR